MPGQQQPDQLPPPPPPYHYQPSELQRRATIMAKSELEVAAEAVSTIVGIIEDPNGQRRQERALHAASIARAAAVGARQVANASSTTDALQNAALAEQLASTAERMAAFL